MKQPVQSLERHFYCPECGAEVEHRDFLDHPDLKCRGCDNYQNWYDDLKEGDKY